MCGAYGFSAKQASDVYDRFEVMNTLPDFHPRYNLRPGQFNPVIIQQSPRLLKLMKWGLIPAKAKDKKISWNTSNARKETVAESWSYRNPFRFRRALIPATFFYEPDKVNYTKPPFP